MDNEGPVMVTYNPSTISVGEVKTVTATATDSAGNNATCTFLAFGIRDSTGKTSTNNLLGSLHWFWKDIGKNSTYYGNHN